MDEGASLLSHPHCLQLQPESSQRPQRRLVRVYAVVGVLGLVGSAFAALAHGSRGHGRRVLTAQSLDRGVTQLTEDTNPCDLYPYLKFAVPHAVEYNNLANKGPDKNHGEGMVYKTIDLGKGAGNEFDREVYLTINATNSHYHPFSPRLNGMQGKYGSINLMPDSHVDLTFSFFDRDTMERLTLPEFAITWFDLDTGDKGQSGEYVKIGGFKSYHLTEQSEVKVTPQKDGRTKFAGTTVGTGEDNPVDPMFLTQQQKNRAVTLLYGPTKSLDVTIGANPGTGPRFFTFVGRPSLLCAVTVQEGFKPPLPDLTFTPPMEGAVMTGEGETFLSFSAHRGQQVHRGEVIATTSRGQGRRHEYLAPFTGEVTQIQDRLKPGEEIDLRLSEKILAVISRPSFDPLPEAPGVIPGGPGLTANLPPDTRFVKYLVNLGDHVQMGDPIAVTSLVGQDGKVTESKVHATAWGEVQARQDGLSEGMLLATVKDKNLITLRPFTSLGPVSQDNQKAAIVREGKGITFVKYFVAKGDIVQVGDRVAMVKEGNGKEMTVRASHSGIVSDLQGLKEGAPIDRVADRNLCTAGKFAPLPVEPGQAPVEISKCLEEVAQGVPMEGMKFSRYVVLPGDIIETGDPIAVVIDAARRADKVVSPRPGVVKRIQDGLQPGMVLNKVMQDENLATIDRLPMLDVSDDEDASFAPPQGDWRFKEWEKNVGDNVAKDGTIAILEQTGGRETEVTAEKAGTVDAREEQLKPGDIVDQVTRDDDIATVGLFKEPSIGFREIGVSVPNMRAKFIAWNVKEGQRVHVGDPLAEFEMPGRRLEESSGSFSRRLVANTLQVPSPATGWIGYKADLTPGQTVKKQSVGPTIATIDLGIPWWLTLGCSLVALCCCFGCLFRVMQKELKPDYKPTTQLPSTPEPDVVETKPEYKPMFETPIAEPEVAEPGPPAPEHQPSPPAVLVSQPIPIEEEAPAPEPVEEEPPKPAEPPAPPAPMPEPPLPPPPREPTPQGVRLDFEDSMGNVNTVYANRRPLGIHHNYSAPIRVHDFTPNSYAKQQLGVRVGWKLVRIGGVNLDDSTDFERVNERLSTALSEWPVWPLPLEFARELGGGTPPIVREFYERPLGLEFTNVAPIRVDRVYKDSPAARQDVEVGWYLTRIGEFDVHENHNFREVLKYFKEGVCGLHDPGRQYLLRGSSC